MAYESNNLVELKREALINRDLPLLSEIVQFEKEEGQRIYYYKRFSEDVVRDKDGNIFDTTLLEIPDHKVWEILWCVEFGQILSEFKGQPGALARDVLDKPGYRDLSKIILEIPDSVTFPIPVDFDWIAVCLQYVKSNEYLTIERRLDGHKFWKVINYIKNNPYDQGLTLMSIENLSNEQIATMIPGL